MNIQTVDNAIQNEAYLLLREINLPVEDIGDNTMLFALRNGSGIEGVIGMEVYGDSALLRSLCVNADYRNKGTGAILVDYLEGVAREKKITEMYLLTLTAADWFRKLGYREVSRDQAKQHIGESAQFNTTCPASTTLMHKKL